MTQDQASRLSPTINDIARVAQVSLASVDQVLNERPGVRVSTFKKFHLMRSAVRIMRTNCDSLPINTVQERIRTDIYLKQNMPLSHEGNREDYT